MLVGAVALSSLLAACGSAGSAGSGSGKVGVAVFLSSSSNSYEQAQAAGAKKAAKSLGAGPVQVFDGGFDSSKQIGQIQDATASGRFKAFVIEPVDSAAVVAPLTRAAKQGIKVVCITGACGSDPIKVALQFPGEAGVVAADYHGAAEQLAKESIDACGATDPCKVFYLNGDSTFPSDRAAKDGFASVMKAAPANVDYVGTQDGKYDTSTGRSVTQSELQRTPGLSVVASLADQQTLGAAQAIDAAGTSSAIKLISFGGSKQALAAVAAGTWYGALVTLPLSIGETGATIAILTAQGKKAAANVVDSSTLATVGGGWLTKANVAQFVAQWTS
jgi:ribose transport system substrate-binding protein